MTSNDNCDNKPMSFYNSMLMYSRILYSKCVRERSNYTPFLLNLKIGYEGFKVLLIYLLLY